MFPIILVSQSLDTLEAYQQEVIRDLDIKPYDIFTYRKDGTVITIDQIREISHLARKSYSNIRLIIIHDFDSALEATQNAFLKTLEEQNERIQFILSVKDENFVISTIRSRSKVLNKNIAPSANHDSSLSFPLMEEYKVMGANIGSSLATTSKISKENALALIDEIIGFGRRQMLTVKNTDYCMVIEEAFNIKNLITRVNLNPEHGIDQLVLLMRSLPRPLS